MSPHSVAGIGNSLNLIVFADGDKAPQAAIHAAVGSFVSDFVARQKLGGSNLNFFVVKQLPILNPAVMSHSFHR